MQTKMRSVINFLERGRAVKRQARKNKEVIYGARSMNKQVAGFYKRDSTFDWDLYSMKPKKSATELKETLDRRAGRNEYYTKPAQFPNTTKVMPG